MEEQYEISVVIPNYNNAKYLTQCIESIERQTYPITQIIVVDDCSSDDSLTVLESLKEKYFNLLVIPLRENGKVSHARNTGLRHVKTPYVTFIDADDIYLNPFKIQNEMNLIQEKKENQNKDVVAYSRIEIVSEQGEKLYSNFVQRKFYLEGNVFSAVLTRKYAFTIMRDYCLPTEALRKVGGYNEANSLYEDLELILKLARRIEFAYTGEVGTGYRRVQSGLSSRPKQLHRDKLNEIFEESIQEFSPPQKCWYRLVRQIHIKENDWFTLKRRVENKIRKVVKKK